MFGVQSGLSSGTNFSFGSQAPAATSAPASSAPTSFSFGTGTLTQPSGLATSTNPLSSSGLTFGSKPTASVAGTASTLGTTSFGIGTGTPATSTSAGGLGGVVSSQAAPSFGFGSAPATTTFKGLGGTTVPGQNVAGAGAQTGTNPKDTPVPPEILATVEEFKKYVEGQKKNRDEIVRFSSAPIHKVSEEATAVHARIVAVGQSMASYASDVKRLKESVMTDSRNVEMAQNTQAISFSLQYENNAPVVFFLRLVEAFDRVVNEYAEQIRTLDKLVSNLTSRSGSSSVSSKDIQNLVNRLYSTVVRLAGEANILHQRLEAEKAVSASDLDMDQMYNPFAVDRSAFGGQPAAFPEVPVGPAPTDYRTSGSMLFSMSDLRSRHQPPPVSGLNMSSFLAGTPQQMPFQQASNFGTSLSMGGGTGFGMNATQAGGSIFGASVENKPGFQLQMPPSSNKRGKR